MVFRSSTNRLCVSLILPCCWCALTVSNVPYRQLTGYAAYYSLSSIATGYSQTTVSGSASLLIRCGTVCTRDSSCSFFIVQSNTCYFHSMYTSFNFIMANSASNIWQKKTNGAFTPLPVFIGSNMSIVNYWAIINGSYQDFVGGSAYTLTPMSGVALIPDRFGNAQGSFQTQDMSNSCVAAPAGLYFASGSFSVTMWINWMATSANHQPLFDFGTNTLGVNDVIFQLIVQTYCSDKSYMSLALTSSSHVEVCTTSSISVGVWTHLAVTYSIATTAINIYLNGVPSGNLNTLTIQNVTRTNNFFGYNNWGDTVKANFDEIKFHSRVLSSAEVLSDYNFNQSYITFV